VMRMSQQQSVKHTMLCRLHSDTQKHAGKGGGCHSSTRQQQDPLKHPQLTCSGSAASGALAMGAVGMETSSSAGLVAGASSLHCKGSDKSRHTTDNT
jgi:hypothetical protein